MKWPFYFPGMGFSGDFGRLPRFNATRPRVCTPYRHKADPAKKRRRKMVQASRRRNRR